MQEKYAFLVRLARTFRSWLAGGNCCHGSRKIRLRTFSVAGRHGLPYVQPLFGLRTGRDRRAVFTRFWPCRVGALGITHAVAWGGY